MDTAVWNLSSGPVLAAGDKGVHIIFVPEGIGSGARGPDGLPTAEQLAEASNYIGTPRADRRDRIRGTALALCRGHAAKAPAGARFVSGHHHTDVVRRRESRLVERGRIRHHQHRSGTPPSSQPTAPAPPPGPAPYPFTFKPMTRTEDDRERSVAKIHVARSTVPIVGARGFEYKISFTRQRDSDRSEHALLAEQELQRGLEAGRPVRLVVAPAGVLDVAQARLARVRGAPLGPRL